MSVRKIFRTNTTCIGVDIYYECMRNALIEQELNYVADAGTITCEPRFCIFINSQLSVQLSSFRSLCTFLWKSLNGMRYIINLLLYICYYYYYIFTYIYIYESILVPYVYFMYRAPQIRRSTFGAVLIFD